MDGLEKSLDEMLVKKAPVQIPENGKKWIVTYVPWINLVVAFFGLLAAMWLWNWAHVAARYVDYANSLYLAAGINTKIDNRLDFWFWLSFLALLASLVVWLVAFPGLQARSKKRGWNLLFYATLLNAVYAVLLLFTGYGFGNFLSSMIGTVLGLYVLFQIRSHYNGHKTTAPDAPKPPAAS